MLFSAGELAFTVGDGWAIDNEAGGLEADATGLVRVARAAGDLGAAGSLRQH